jgi:hypothetical protein
MRLFYIVFTLIIVCSGKNLMKQDLKTGCVQLFDLCNFEGKSRVVCQDDPKFGDDNDLYSSMKLGPLTTATIFKNFNYKGTLQYIEKDVACFEKDYPKHNDNISSIMIYIPVKPGCVDLYDYCDYMGPKYTVCEDISNFKAANIPIKTSSFRLGAGINIQLFSETDYKGINMIFKKDEFCLDEFRETDPMNNVALSIKIFKI